MLVEPLDSTAIGILAGAAVTVTIAIWHGIRRRAVSVFAVALDFLATFGLLAAANLIWAAFRGDPTELPSAWREYVAVTGVIGIGFALQHLARTAISLASRLPEHAIDDSTIVPESPGITTSKADRVGRNPPP